MSNTKLSELRSGAIAFMARNPVAANLMMFTLLIGGLMGMFRVKQEVFPAFEMDVVQVTVVYPGASPEEVSQGIVLAVEEATRGVDGVKHVSSSAGEGVGMVAVDLLVDADPQQALADIKNEVDRISSFPEDAEEPTVALLANVRKVVELLIVVDEPGEQARDEDLPTLHAIAEHVRGRLLEDPGITKVEIGGLPPLELSIEVPRETLDAYGLTLDDVARSISASSVELPGGELETRSGEILVKLDDRAVALQEFRDIVVRAGAGAELRLGDIATLHDGYADNDLAYYYQGQRALQVVTYRVGDETPGGVAAATRKVAEELRGELPQELSLVVWSDDSEMLAGRIDLLLSNARLGLLLVLVVLALFLDLRMAFWVGMGIPITFLGTFFIMPGLDLSVNMVSLFAFIVTLGLVVDDAIVISENAYSKHEQGMPWLEASIAGAKEMRVPVTFAILTTVAAFFPLFLVPGFMGKIFSVIPAVTISVLVFSLIESFFILPAHMGHAGRFFEWKIWRPVHLARDFVDRSLQRFIVGPFTTHLRFVLRHRLLAWAGAMAMLVFTIGLLKSGTVPFSFFPKLESDKVTVSARLPYGAAAQDSEALRRTLEASLDQAIAELDHPSVVKGQLSMMGQGAAAGGPGGGARAAGSHLVTMQVSLVASEERDISSKYFGELWKKHTPPIAGVESLVFSSSSGPGAGAAVDLQLSHPDEQVLAQASAEIEQVLRGYEDLSDVENTYASGKPQMSFALSGRAHQLGLSSAEVGRQVRAAFFGTEALREQRGRNELRVMVRLPEDQRSSEYDLEALKVRAPRGGFVPLGSVVEFTREQAPTTITREDGLRIINVRAELAAGVASPQVVLESLNTKVLPELLARTPGLKLSMAGSQREQAETMASLKSNYLIALFVMYVLLAVPFRSYLQPFIIMAAIPFGFVGAVFGHVIMQYGMSIISMFGVIALSGVVINDSLVLLDAVKSNRAAGASAHEAVVLAANRRFRPILLTSLTTFFGLAPMIMETSVQARFLIPMAISLGFGVLFATVIVLLIIPALYLLMEDALNLVGSSLAPDPEDAEAEPEPVMAELESELA